MTSKSLPALLAVLPVGLLATGCPDEPGGTGTASMTSMAATDTADPTTDEPTTATPTTDEPTTTSMPTTNEPTTDEPTTDEPTTDDPTTGTPGDGASFRFASMQVRDPHFFGMTLVGCIDVTDDVPIGSSVNEQFNEAINMDTDADGFLDLSLMLLFRGDGIDQADGGSGDLDFANGQCMADGSSCDIRPNSELQPTMYTSQASGVCHEADPAHLSSEGYSPAPGSTMGPCFHAGPSDVTIVTSSFELPLIGAEIAGTYQGDPATSLMSGTLRGFLTTTVAEATMLPKDLAGQVGVDTVAGLLPGHADSCADHDDTDMGPNGESGWWFYVDFTALGSNWVGP